MKKHGFAIPVVLIFATSLAIIGTFIFRSTRNYNSQTRINMSQLQAHYLARAGFEHAMLKIKFLNRELYDAACLSQGINPLFDFTGADHISPHSTISQYNPGPIFLFKSGHPGLELTGLFPKTFPQANKDQWLNAFQQDIISGINIDGVNYNWCMNANPLPNDIRGLMREPFTGQYQITGLRHFAREVIEDSVDPNKISNFAIIEMTIDSTINNDRDENFNFQMRKTIKVSRDNVM